MSERYSLFSLRYAWYLNPIICPFSPFFRVINESSPTETAVNIIMHVTTSANWEDPALFEATDWTKSTRSPTKRREMRWDERTQYERLLFQRWNDLRAAYNERLCESGQCDITILRSDATLEPKHHCRTDHNHGAWRLYRQTWSHPPSSNHTDGEVCDSSYRLNTCILSLCTEETVAHRHN